MSRDFLSSPKGRLLLHRSRRRRRITLDIRGIEPRGKKSMPESDKLAFQREVLRQLKEKSRSAFRGPLMLSVSLSTTHRTPNHAPKVAKNLLDLLGKPLATSRTSRKAILYRDDAHVEGLTVVCKHGQSAPRIIITAVPFEAFLQDLGLAMYARDCTPSASERRSDRLAAEIEMAESALWCFRQLRHQEHAWRTRLGGPRYELDFQYWQTRAQQWLFGRPPISVSELGDFYGAHGWELDVGRLPVRLSSEQEADLQDDSFRITLPELPQREGTSRDYLRLVDEKLRAFQERFAWVLTPLRIPVGLQVLVKPPPPERARGPNDLDNVLSYYLIRRTVDLLEPPYAASLYDLNEMRAATSIEEIRAATAVPDPLGHCLSHRSTVPASARIGLTRYEAWRLPRAQGDTTPGFVSMCLVADRALEADTLGLIDSTIGDLEELD